MEVEPGSRPPQLVMNRRGDKFLRRRIRKPPHPGPRAERSAMTKEQRDVLEAVARWIWWGSQAATDKEGGRRFRHWDAKVQRRAVRWLNAHCGRDDRASPAVLNRMLAELRAPRGAP